MHHLSIFDELVQSSLAKYPSAQDTDLLVLMATIPPSILTLTQTRIICFLAHLGIDPDVFVVDTSSRGLGILSIYPEEHAFDRDCFRVGRHWDQDIVMDVYHQYLLEFFMDDTRSERYFLSAEVYLTAALKVLQFLSTSQ